MSGDYRPDAGGCGRVHSGLDGQLFQAPQGRLQVSRRYVAGVDPRLARDGARHIVDIEEHPVAGAVLLGSPFQRGPRQWRPHVLRGVGWAARAARLLTVAHPEVIEEIPEGDL